MKTFCLIPSDMTDDDVRLAREHIAGLPRGVGGSRFARSDEPPRHPFDSAPLSPVMRVAVFHVSLVSHVMVDGEPALVWLVERER